ncbi:uncharacterized protein TNCV_2524441 [Trichonephila clavipes]|nr:uncharacterized protein TNCV_2524441 [Trichonephila clavipes]
MVFWGSFAFPLAHALEEIDSLGIPLRSFWPTLHCRRVAGVSPLLSIGWWCLSSVSPKRHCYRVSAADMGWWVYPLDPRPDAAVLYSGFNPDENITKIKCPPLKLLQPLSSILKPNILTSTPVSTSSSTQVQLLPSTSSIAATVSEPQPPIPTSNDAPSTNMFTRMESPSSIIPASPSNSDVHPKECKTDFEK